MIIIIVLIVQMNINFSLEENVNCDDEQLDIYSFLQEFETQKTNQLYSNDTIFAQMKNYDSNFNLKQLSLICEYYKININKLKKQEVIEQVILFENNDEHIVIVIKRKEMWYYLNELKKMSEVKLTEYVCPTTLL